MFQGDLLVKSVICFQEGPADCPLKDVVAHSLPQLRPAGVPQQDLSCSLLPQEPLLLPEWAACALQVGPLEVPKRNWLSKP